jgi:cholinesterase
MKVSRGTASIPRLASVLLQILLVVLIGSPISVLGQRGPAAPPRRDGFQVGQNMVSPAGTFLGAQSPFRTTVSAYLGIRYGQAPVRNLRFARPYRAEPLAQPATAQAPGPDCPTLIGNVTQTMKLSNGALRTLTIMSQAGRPISEDCLFLNVWTKPQLGERMKAVVVFVHGGGFAYGSSANALYDGSILADEQDLVVVSINYRLGIFGFPSGPGAAGQNVGILDIRIALEWVRDNIASFGGDPDRIVLMGQGSGAEAIDIYSHAYMYNTIVKGLILMSGQARDKPVGGDNSSAWYSVTSKLDCGGPESGTATIDCSRVRKMEDILQYSTEAGPFTYLQSAFGPHVDNILVFPNYEERVRQGRFAKIPVLIGNTHNEGGIYRLLPFTNPAGLNGVPTGVWEGLNRLAFSCPAATMAKERSKFNIPVWRYRFFATFDNTEIIPSAGAYDGIDLLTLFGNVALVSGIPDSPNEVGLGKYMRGAFGAFIKDPFAGLGTFSWPVYNPDSKYRYTRVKQILAV